MSHLLVVEWWKFFAALVLLLTPVALLEGPRVHFRDIDRDWDRHWTQILSLWLHYFDFARAAIGTWLLLSALHPVVPAHGLARYAPLLLQGSIRVLAVFLQTVWCREEDSVNAPFAFVTGLILTGVSPLAATIALALAIPLAAGARSPVAFFPLLSIVFTGASFLFGGKGLFVQSIVGAAAPFVPWLWSLLFRRSLVIPYLSRQAMRTTPPLP